MITKLFKKPLWQHKKPTLRIQAIQEQLDPTHPEHKATLLELMQQDSEEMVCRAALIKVNDPEIYWQCAQQHHFPKLQKFAKQQLWQMYRQQQTSLPTSIENALLASAPKAELEKLLFESQEPEQIIALFNLIDKPQLAPQIFRAKAITQVQLAMLEHIADLPTLEKLIKKSVNDDVQQAVEQKVAALKYQQALPEKISKQAQLLLSQYLALKDEADYEKVLLLQQQYQEQWQQLLAEFDCLADDQRQQFIDKYQQIEEKLAKLFVVKAEQYQQQKLAEQLALQRSQQFKEINQQLTLLSQQLSDAVFCDEAIDVEQYQQQIEQLKTAISASLLLDAEKQQLLTQVNKQAEQVKHLPEIAASVAKATQLISQFSTFSLPENLSQYNEKLVQFERWQSDWRKVVKQAGDILPLSLQQAHNEIVQHWQQGTADFKQQQQQLEKQLTHKLHDLKRLIRIGKFNACFAIHRSVLEHFDELNKKQQARLQRDFDFVNEKMAELSDWERYVATPKKQALLAEIQQLVTQPLDNPLAQAEQIKLARKQWNSFGHAEQDELLNQAFNEVCEQAFAPCRQFFAEQEKIREQNLKVREQLITQAAELHEQFDLTELSAIDWKKLEGSLNRLEQKWRNAGEVDHQNYRRVNQQFKEAITPFKAALQHFYQQNVEQKKQLIKQAESLKQAFVDGDSSALDTLKKLQQDWRSIGFAGARNENKLWQQFRAINDEVFALRDQQKEQQSQQAERITAQIQQQLQQITVQLSSIKTLTQWEQLTTQFEQLRDETSSAMSYKLLVKDIQQVEKQLHQKQVELKKSLKNQSWKQLFDVLEALAKQEISTEAQLMDWLASSQVKLKFHKLLLLLLADQNPSQREELTLTLEVIAGLPSPQECQEQRRALQIQLMQQKLNEGETLTLNTLFEQWLTAGKLTTADLPLISRVKQVFLTSNSHQRC